MPDNKPEAPTEEPKTQEVKEVEAFLEEKGYVLYARNGIIGSNDQGQLVQVPAQVIVEQKPQEKPPVEAPKEARDAQ